MKGKKQTIARRNVSWYGWRPDLPDQRDLAFEPGKKLLQRLPASVDLRPLCPRVYSQGTLGSCTANAIAAAIQYGFRKQDRSFDFMPSRLFIYYNERVMERTVGCDNGAEIRNGIKSVNKQGVCPEGMWPYTDRGLRYQARPTLACYKEALKHQVLKYYRISHDLTKMKACLAQGYPFVFGFSVYQEFEGDKITKTGILNMPDKNDEQLGGHAVLCVGYDDKTKRFLVRNSWNTDWGMKGYFTMPYKYLLNKNLAEDFWTIRVVELSK